MILKSILFSSEYVCNNCRSSAVLRRYMPDFPSVSVLGLFPFPLLSLPSFMVHLEERSHTKHCQVIAVLLKKYVCLCLFSCSLLLLGYTHAYICQCSQVIFEKKEFLESHWERLLSMIQLTFQCFISKVFQCYVLFGFFLLWTLTQRGQFFISFIYLITHLFTHSFIHLSMK